MSEVSITRLSVAMNGVMNVRADLWAVTGLPTDGFSYFSPFLSSELCCGSSAVLDFYPARPSTIPSTFSFIHS